MIKRSRNGDFLPIVLGTLGAILFACIALVVFDIRAMGGLVIWDASVYYFSHIPNDVDWNAAIVTSIGAVVFCLIGAAIPSAKAADIDPVKALRHVLAPLLGQCLPLLQMGLQRQLDRTRQHQCS